MELRRPRAFGQLLAGLRAVAAVGTERVLEERLGNGREEVPWAKVLELLVVSRLLAPGSEFRLHRQGFDQSANGGSVGHGLCWWRRKTACIAPGPHRGTPNGVVRSPAATLARPVPARFDVLLYDLTSTYIEGEGEEIPKAQHGYSRITVATAAVVIALVVTPEGFPLAYEVLAAHSDRNHAAGISGQDRERSMGRRGAFWVMDRGIPCEEVLQEMRTGDGSFYLVGTPRGKIQQYESNGWTCPGRRCASRWT